MDKLAAILPHVLTGNGVLDLFIALDPTGAAVKDGAQKLFSPLEASATKDILVSAFYSSMLIHGFARIVAARDLGNKYLKTIAILSYFVECFQAVRLYSQGAIAMPDGAPFIVAPLGLILLLLVAKPKDNNNEAEKNQPDSK